MVINWRVGWRRLTFVASTLTALVGCYLAYLRWTGLNQDRQAASVYRRYQAFLKNPGWAISEKDITFEIFLKTQPKVNGNVFSQMEGDSARSLGETAKSFFPGKYDRL